MSESKAFVLDAMRRQGQGLAQALQEEAPGLTGTELNARDGYIPDFLAAVAAKNMLERPLGFVCRSSAGRVVRLIQNYDSDIYTAEPEELPAQWGFAWSQDPAKALPFIALATSPYATGDCCLNAAGEAKRSKMDNNVFDPDQRPEYWEDA